MEGVRYREGEWEGQCSYCVEYWPLDIEFWRPEKGLRKCRACERLQTRIYHSRVRMDPETRRLQNEAMRDHRRLKRSLGIKDDRSWYARNRERINAEKRAAYAQAKAQLGIETKPRLTDEERQARKRARDREYAALHRKERNASNRVRYYLKRLSKGKALKPEQSAEVKVEQRRAYNREWMRADRAKKKAA